MDGKVVAVLEFYHKRMQEEAEQRHERPAPGEGGSWRDQVLLAVGPETGQLINILASSLRAPHILEVGTSYGYSGIWLAEAARKAGGRVTTMELQDYKATYARERAVEAGTEARGWGAIGVDRVAEDEGDVGFAELVVESGCGEDGDGDDEGEGGDACEEEQEAFCFE